MHSYLPHPKDNLVILKFQECFDEVDHWAVQCLLRSRVHGQGRIWILLQFQDFSLADSAWTIPLLDEDVRASIERLALVARPNSMPSMNSLFSSLPDAVIRQFDEEHLEAALHWVQAGDER